MPGSPSSFHLAGIFHHLFNMEYARRAHPHPKALIDPSTDPGLDDLHGLFGALCALAELQLALPDDFSGSRRLHQVLDRRPFI